MLPTDIRDLILDYWWGHKMYVLKKELLRELSINRYFKISIIEFGIISFSMFLSFYLLNLGYPFIAHFLVILVQTFIVFIITILILLKFYKSFKLKSIIGSDIK